MNKLNSKYGLLALGVLGLVIIYILASFVVPRALVTFTKAAPATVVSLADSYLIGEKILAKADGVDSCKIDVFVLDKSGKGVPGKRVSLNGASGITALNEVTNNEGKASFTVTSAIEDQYKLEASIEGSLLARALTITFRN